MGRIIRNEKGLTLIEMLIGILVFTLATVFIVSLVANAIDKPKVAGIKGTMDFYDKEASLLLHEVSADVGKQELFTEYNKELTRETRFNSIGEPPLEEDKEEDNGDMTMFSLKGNSVSTGDITVSVLDKEGNNLEGVKVKLYNVYSMEDGAIEEVYIESVVTGKSGGMFDIMLDKVLVEGYGDAKQGVLKAVIEDVDGKYDLAGYTHTMVILNESLFQLIGGNEEMMREMVTTTFGEDASIGILTDGFKNNIEFIITEGQSKGKTKINIEEEDNIGEEDDGGGGEDNGGEQFLNYMGKSIITNAYGNAYYGTVEKSNNQTAIIVTTVGKKDSERYSMVVVKEGGTVETCTRGFGRYDKKLVTLSSPWCDGDFVGGDIESGGGNEENGGEEENEESGVEGCYSWGRNEEGVTITKYNCDEEHVIVPSTIKGKNVTVIGERSFHYNYNIKSVVLPDTVVTIESEAFKYTSLKTVDLGNSITKIEKEAFGNSSLQSIVLPDGLIEIGESAFNSNIIGGAVVIPDSVNKIGTEAFYDNRIEELILPNSPMEIGEYVFYNNRIKNLEIPRSLTVIELGMFGMNRIEELNIPEWVTSIKADAFSNNLMVTLDIPDNITVIERNTFADSFKLTSLNLPDTLTEIGNNAFRNSKLATKITIPNSVTRIGDYAFNGTDVAEIIIGNSVESIGEYAFSTNRLQSLDIPYSVTHIGRSAFGSNRFQRWKNVHIPNPNAVIEQFAFDKHITVTQATN